MARIRALSGPEELKQPNSVVAEVPLPPAPPSVLVDLAHSRESCRSFSPRRLELETMGSLLAAAYGLVRNASNDGQPYYRRLVPSAGGLYPLESYGFVRRTDGATDGLYHYDVPGHALQLIVEGDLSSRLEPIFYTYPYMCEANVVLVIVAVFGRTQKKYGPRGYRYILLEAGHAAQNICLPSSSVCLRCTWAGSSIRR